MRKPIVAGNWKMNKSVEEATELVTNMKIDLSDMLEVEVVLCPPFTALKAVSDTITGSQMKLGAQNMHSEPSGAFTGEISAQMLRNLYCRYVILGHSERRALFGETSEVVNCKVKAAIEASLRPIMCVGETLDEREGGRASEIVHDQLQKGLVDVSKGIRELVVAYEPVWAIGTGLSATPEQAQEMHAFIRKTLEELYDKATASAIRIQYGGSVKPKNAAELFSLEDIDGGLIGGAALEARSFVEIVKAAL